MLEIFGEKKAKRIKEAVLDHFEIKKIMKMVTQNKDICSREMERDIESKNCLI
jgi:hypothetical protein